MVKESNSGRTTYAIIYHQKISEIEVYTAMKTTKQIYSNKKASSNNLNMVIANPNSGQKQQIFITNLQCILHLIYCTYNYPSNT